MKLNVLRRIVQILGALLPNSYFQVFVKDGSIYQGGAKGIVPPILNCYATPTAYSSCPVGSTQHFFVIGAFPYLVVGALAVFGATVGRMSCGWICPFGFFQDLWHKIPGPKLKMPKFFNYLKYVALLVLVIILPLWLQETFFCKACPAGGLTGGIPQIMINPPLRDLLGSLFTMKMVILGSVLILTWLMSRFFCRALCPLGAFLGLFNKASAFSLQLKEDKCIHCGICAKVCPTGLDPVQTPNSPDCIRCLECVHKCPTDALVFRSAFSIPKPKLKEVKA